MLIRGLLVTMGLGLLISCKATNARNDASPSELFTKSYTGYDMHGNARTCIVEDAEEDCGEHPVEQGAFADACSARQGEVLRCSCTLVLCSAKDRTTKKSPKK